MKTILLLLSCLLFLSSDILLENEAVGEIKFKIGKVVLKRDHSEPVSDFSVSSKIYVNDLIETKEEARCELKLNDGTIVKINQSSLFKVDKLKKGKKDERRSFSLFFGKLWVKAKKLFNPTDEFSIRTPTAVAAIRGTEFFVSAKDSNHAKILVKEGNVDVGNVDMLTNFDSFIDFIKNERVLFEQWKQKNNGEDFYNNEYKEYKSFINAEKEAYENFVSGKNTKKKDEWIKSVNAGKILIIQGKSRASRPFTQADLKEFD